MLTLLKKIPRPSCFQLSYLGNINTMFTLQKLSLDICAIRLDYVKFVTRGPDVDTSPYTVCSHDTVRADT